MIPQHDTFRKSSKSICFGAAMILAAGALCSCGEDKEEQSPKSTYDTAASTEATKSEQCAVPGPGNAKSEIDKAQKELFEILLYNTADTIAELARHPELQAPAQLLLEKLQAYDDVLSAHDSNKLESARIALTIAKTCSSLNAGKRAEQNYQKALDRLLILAKEDDTQQIKRLMSTAYNGLAFSKLSQKDVTSALVLYKKQLALDEALFELVAPAASSPPPVNSWSDEIALASSNLISSYRCLGDALSANDELEDARDTYRKGIKHASTLNKLSQNMTMQYIKLLTAMGNLESRCNKEKEALQAWSAAAKLAQKINEVSKTPSVKFESKRAFDTLLPLIKRISAKLQAQEEAQKAATKDELKKEEAKTNS